MKNTPIILVEDDKDDQELMQSIITDLKLPYQLKIFDLTEDAFRYLKTTSDVPFIILCDINLPKQNGFQFKQQIDNDKELRTKSIPFIFLSTTSSKPIIDKAYAQLTIQGFFVKPVDYNKARQLIKMIIDYWINCQHPNT